MKLKMLAWTIAMTSCAALVAPALPTAQDYISKAALIDLGQATEKSS